MIELYGERGYGVLCAEAGTEVEKLSAAQLEKLVSNVRRERGILWNAEKKK